MSTSVSISPMRKADAVDDAGGEIVYSSDGIDALPLAVARKQPSAFAQQQQQQQTLTFGDHDILDQGETYNMQEAYEKFAPKRTETPRETLHRLQREIESVAVELDSDAALQTDVNQLLARMQHYDNALQLLETGSSKTQPNNVVTSDLEALLLRLEQTVGSMSAPDARNNRKCLLERVALLEKRSAVLLDDAQLEAAARKAKVIRHDLEAAGKARNKLANSKTDAADFKIIAALYDRMIQVDGVHEHLPALTKRLETLTHQHADASTWSLRLVAVEQLLSRLQTQMTSCETSCAILQTSWETNAKRLEATMRDLDQRMAVLKASGLLK
jgi:hypothetical protein